MESEPDIIEIAEAPRPRRRRKWRRWLVLLIVVAGIAWLNGPGWRWIAPKVADHFLEGSGMHASFELEGRLTGGVSVRDLRVESESVLAGMTADRVSLVYRFRELVRGQIDGIEVEGLHVELGLEGDAQAESEEVEDPDGGKKALDLKGLVKTLRVVRELAIPVSVDVQDLSLDVTRDGVGMISLAESSIHHVGGEAEIDLDVGAITDAVGNIWPARQSEIVWNNDAILIDRIDPLPDIGVRALVLRLPESGELSAEAELHLDQAVFTVNAPPGLKSLQLGLREGELRSETLAGHFGLKLPARGVLRSLSVNATKLLPDPTAATGEVRLLLDDVEYEEWTMPELSLDVELTEDRASLATRGVMLGSEFSLNGEVALERDGGEFQLGDARGRFNVAEVSKLVRELGDKLDALKSVDEVPESMLDGGFNVSFSENLPRAADVDLLLKPADAGVATSLAVKARWRTDEPVTGEVEIDGLRAKAEYDIKASTYKGTLEIDDFKSARIDAWLAAVGAGTDGAASLNGKWQGGGELKEGKHKGTLLIDRAGYAKEEMPAIAASAEVAYDWPEEVEVRELKAEAAGQKVSLGLKLAEGLLALENLSWIDRETVMAGGSGSLPVPEDFSKWREMLAKDERPLVLDIQSEVLPLAMLKEVVPDLEGKIDPRSTGHLHVKVSGTYAKPELDALVEVKELRSPEQPDLPPADIRLKLGTRDNHLSVEGRVTTPDFKPALLTASMPFRPVEWAEKPELIKEESISARVDLPKINLSRFAQLVPPVKKIDGVLTGNVEVGGQLGKPEVKGVISLTGGGAVMKNADFPQVTGAGLSVDLGLDRVTLKDLKASVAGGSLTGSGSLELDAGKPKSMDFRLLGKHLPVMRNDSLIVRTNLDLKLSGPWESATLGGTVGLVDSLFYRDIELIPVGKPFTSPSAAALPKIDTAAPTKKSAKLPEPFVNWGVNVTARTETPFLVRGNFATGRVDANIRVGGTFAAPAPDGEVRISDFKAALPLSTLKIKSGTVLFKPDSGLDPIIEIRGTAEPRPYRVNVFVYGKASDPKLALTSNPPLPENEIMTLLATGTTTSGLEDPQAASSKAMQLLAEEFRRGRMPLGKQLRPVLGLLDRVDFSVAEEDPYSSVEYSTATISINDNWYVTAGMGAEGESRFLGYWRFSFK